MNFQQYIVFQLERQLQLFYNQPLCVLIGNSSPCQIKRLCSRLLSLKVMTLDTFRHVVDVLKQYPNPNERVLILPIFRNFVSQYLVQLSAQVNIGKQSQMHICEDICLKSQKLMKINQMRLDIIDKFGQIEFQVRKGEKSFRLGCHQIYSYVNSYISSILSQFQRIACCQIGHTQQHVKYESYKEEMKKSLPELRKGFQGALKRAGQKRLSQSQKNILKNLLTIFQQNEDLYAKLYWDESSHYLYGGISAERHHSNFSSIDPQHLYNNRKNITTHSSLPIQPNFEHLNHQHQRVFLPFPQSSTQMEPHRRLYQNANNIQSQLSINVIIRKKALKKIEINA